MCLTRTGLCTMQAPPSGTALTRTPMHLKNAHASAMVAAVSLSASPGASLSVSREGASDVDPADLTVTVTETTTSLPTMSTIASINTSPTTTLVHPLTPAPVLAAAAPAVLNNALVLNLEVAAQEEEEEACRSAIRCTKSAAV